MGYSEKGLYIAAELKGSKAKVNDPKWFWAQDCLEIFLDSDNSKSKRKYEPTDHQFWFCPLVEEKRVYAGRWKRHSEISATRYDLDGIDSFSKKTEDGFIIELFIPSSKINGFKGQAGEKIGMNLNFTIPKSTGNGEIFWPISKKMNISEEPWNWGTIELK